LTKPTQAWLKKFGLALIDVVPIDTKGGSFRIFAQRSGGVRAVAATVGHWIDREESTGMFAQPFFDRVGERLACITQELHAIVDSDHRRGRTVGGFGVSVGTSTLLAQFKLADKIDFLVDDDTKKEPFLVGPGYRIPVITGEACNERIPGTIIVFAWRYAAQIRRRHAAYLRAGGSFVVPLPRVKVLQSESAGSAVSV
jgi:hypothetical protein